MTILMLASWTLFFILALLSNSDVQAVEWSKFKTCADIGFCRRHRHFTASSGSIYKLDPFSLTVSKWRSFPALTAPIEGEDRPTLLLVVLMFTSGIARVIIDDLDPQNYSRHVVKDVILPHVSPSSLTDVLLSASTTSVNASLPGASHVINIQGDPLRINFLSVDAAVPLLTVNADDRLLCENFAEKPVDPPSHSAAPESDGDPSKENDSPKGDRAEPSDSACTTECKDQSPSPTPCDGCWSETFKSHTDPKVRGPESIGCDIEFPSARHIYGIPERTVNFSVPDTVNLDGTSLSEPHRMYNLDVFEFELDKPLGLYGSVPLVYTRGKDFVIGTFWLNSAETYVDVHTTQTGKKTHWYSESGLLDLFLLPGPSASEVYQQYLWLTGKPAMPQRFALGYHQCRWNYRDDEDARAVDSNFDKHDIPYDVLWLDIEHTDGKRYFTWDLQRFPDPTALQQHVAQRGRKMVTIIDPHVKRDDKYELHRIGMKQNLYVNTPEGKPYDGWCWPGSSSYFDFTSPRVREAFASMFHPDKYPHFTEHLYTWNDMNEPSVFNGPEGTMPKNMIHESGIEHRHVHNIYGHYFMQATFEGLLKGHGGNDRPFVLSRSFFAGSQRFGAFWTGDNTASWEHMTSSARMVLPLQICGLVFSGADVGGFFGNPAPDLLTRWYQLGAFQPFFRGHAHLDTNRREPWLFGEPYTSVIASAIRTRYQYIVFWYTLFAGNVLGVDAGFKISHKGPPMRPMWWEFGNDAESEYNEKQWMVGNALLCAPVTEEGVSIHAVYLPDGEEWYDIFAPEGAGKRMDKKGHIQLEVSLDRMVVFQRGGTVVVKQERRRRSTRSMAGDPYTLVVALDKKGCAEGELFLDDGKSYAYESGEYVLRGFRFCENELRAETLGGKESIREAEALVERVVIFGYGSSAPQSVVTEGNENVDFVWNEQSNVLTLQRLKLLAGRDAWSIKIAT